MTITVTNTIAQYTLTINQVLNPSRTVGGTYKLFAHNAEQLLQVHYSAI